MSTSLNECLLGCQGLSTEHGWLRKSPYQLCVNACKKGSKHDTGYGDPDEIFEVGLSLDAEIDAALSNMPGMNFDEETDQRTYYTTEDMGDPRLLWAALALAGGLIYLGMRG
tara:strand:- start:2412 stop:2747 length:336 start_codon:yes stop_codon:yes gene_type:complete